MCNFDHKHQRYLAFMSKKLREDYPELATIHFFTTIITQNTFNKCKSDIWTYTNRHAG